MKIEEANAQLHLLDFSGDFGVVAELWDL